LIGSDVIRGYSDILILYQLLHRDSYGYQISRNIREITNENYVMKETTLYSALSRLESGGYIRSYRGDLTMGKPRTYFCITEDGRRYYADKCAEYKLINEVVDLFISEEYR